MKEFGPDPNAKFPNANIIVGDYTYYDDIDGAENNGTRLGKVYSVN